MTKQEVIEILEHLKPSNQVYTANDAYAVGQALCIAIKSLEQEPTTKNDLGVDCISRQSVLDKIQRLINAEQNNIDENGDYMNYARERVNAYEAIQFFVENDCLCPSVTPQEPKTGYLSIDDVMSVFDDFMCGEVDEDGTETFWEMLKDKAESEAE